MFFDTQYRHMTDYQLIQAYNRNRDKVARRLADGFNTINGHETKIMRCVAREAKRRKLRL